MLVRRTTYPSIYGTSVQARTPGRLIIFVFMAQGHSQGTKTSTCMSLGPTHRAPRFSNLSLSWIDFATVTPSAHLSNLIVAHVSTDDRHTFCDLRASEGLLDDDVATYGSGQHTLASPRTKETYPWVQGLR